MVPNADNGVMFNPDMIAPARALASMPKPPKDDTTAVEIQAKHLCGLVMALLDFCSRTIRLLRDAYVNMFRDTDAPSHVFDKKVDSETTTRAFQLLGARRCDLRALARCLDSILANNLFPILHLLPQTLVAVQDLKVQPESKLMKYFFLAGSALHNLNMLGCRDHKWHSIFQAILHNGTVSANLQEMLEKIPGTPPWFPMQTMGSCSTQI